MKTRCWRERFEVYFVNVEDHELLMLPVPVSVMLALVIFPTVVGVRHIT